MLPKCVGHVGVPQTSMVSLVYSQSELVAQEALLVQRIDYESKGNEPLEHFKAVVFIRPTPTSVGALIRHLRQCLKYKEYHVCKSHRRMDYYDCFQFSPTSSPKICYSKLPRQTNRM